MSNVKPELKQFGDLSPADFERHPVWIACHTEDFAEPWFNETDEETFRPWTGTLPVGPSDGMFLVRATFELHDGSHHDGFLTPAFKEGEIAALHPHLFVGDKSFGFWGGRFGVRADRRSAFYNALGKKPRGDFPDTVQRRPGVGNRDRRRAGRWLLSGDAHFRSGILGHQRCCTGCPLAECGGVEHANGLLTAFSRGSIGTVGACLWCLLPQRILTGRQHPIDK